MYVDGFVIPVPRRKLAAYRRVARKAGKVWMEHGALSYVECAGDDLRIKGVMPFGKTVRAKPSETVCFSWITYRSRAHRDRVNAKVMADPRLANMMEVGELFDMKRMAYGGFTSMVNL